MIQSTISLQDYELSEDGLYKIEVPVEGLTGQYTIICDGKQDLNNCDMDYYGDDGIIVTRNRCELTVQITPNKTQFVREYTIMCRHTNDYYVYAEIVFTQQAEEYRLTTETATVTLKGEVPWKEGDAIYNIEEIKIPVNVTGGNGKYRIKSISTYKGMVGMVNKKDLILFTDETDEQIQYSFNNGFKYVIEEDGIRIKNYGKIFLDNSYYYKMTLCHAEDKDLVKTVILKYDILDLDLKNTVTENEVTPTDSGNDNTISLMAKFSNVSDFIEEIEEEVEEEKEEIPQIYEVSVQGLDEEGKIVIYGQNSNEDITYNVTLNGVNTNTPIRVSTSCRWCTTYVDESNKKIRFSITNRPLSTRNALVKIYLFNTFKPEILFTLTNKPS